MLCLCLCFTCVLLHNLYDCVCDLFVCLLSWCCLKIVFCVLYLVVVLHDLLVYMVWFVVPVVCVCCVLVLFVLHDCLYCVFCYYIIFVFT